MKFIELLFSDEACVKLFRKAKANGLFCSIYGLKMVKGYGSYKHEISVINVRLVSEHLMMKLYFIILALKNGL
jgi:hypothetical protein